MRALVATGPGVLEIAEVPIPEIDDHRLLIRTRVSAVSPGSELRGLFEGGPFPRIGGTGYIASGIVERIGARVVGFKAGDRVHFTTGGVGEGPHAEFCTAHQGSPTLIPDGMSFLSGACAYWAVPPYRGIIGSGIRFYDDVAVLGLGPLGLCAVQMLRHFARRVVAADVVPMRCDLGREVGADLVVNPAETDLAGAVREMMPRGPAAVFELSGTQKGLEQAMAICAPRGAVVVIGVQRPLVDFQMFRPMQDKGIRLLPIWRRGDSLDPEVDRGFEFKADVLDMIARGKLDVDRLATWVGTWRDGPDLIPRLYHERDKAIAVALTWDG